MSNIKYVCMSDLHLGEEDSVLTNVEDLTNPNDVMKTLVECLKGIISRNDDKNDRPTLILAGDILELALSTTDEAAKVFVCFIKEVLPNKEDKLFKDIVIIPGNHDHHLWELARETMFVQSLEGNKEIGKPIHATNILDDIKDLPESYMIRKLIEHASPSCDCPVHIAYPGYGLFNKSKDKCVIIDHGHYVENIYYLMSMLKELMFMEKKIPTTLHDLEAENFAWIDFFWSTLGRSGTMGQGIEKLYEELLDKEALKKRLGILANNLAKKYDIPVIPGDRAESAFLKKGFNFLVDKFLKEEKKEGRFLSDNSKKRLLSYLTGPVFNKIMEENSNKLPQEITFVFGHTHKPFQKDIRILLKNLETQENDIPDNVKIDVYNMGGWVVEDDEPIEKHGGAVALIDEDYNVVSLRMYNEEFFNPEVRFVNNNTGVDKFEKDIRKRLSEIKNTCLSWSSIIEKELKIKQDRLSERLKNVRLRIKQEEEANNTI